MSEQRIPDEVILHRVCPDSLAKNSEEKCRKFELFRASHWALKWEPWSKHFFPKPSNLGQERKNYWLGMYRVRIDGKWHGEKAKYHFYSREDIVRMVMSL